MLMFEFKHQPVFVFAEDLLLKILNGLIIDVNIVINKY